MKISEIDPRLVENPKRFTICKLCKFNAGKPDCPFCEKYPRDGIEPKPITVTYRYGRNGKCPRFEEK